MHMEDVKWGLDFPSNGTLPWSTLSEGYNFLDHCPKLSKRMHLICISGDAFDFHFLRWSVAKIPCIWILEPKFSISTQWECPMCLWQECCNVDCSCSNSSGRGGSSLCSQINYEAMEYLHLFQSASSFAWNDHKLTFHKHFAQTLPHLQYRHPLHKPQHHLLGKKHEIEKGTFRKPCK